MIKIIFENEEITEIEGYNLRIMPNGNVVYYGGQKYGDDEKMVHLSSIKLIEVELDKK